MFNGKLVPPGLTFEKVAFGPEEINSGELESSKFITILVLILELLGS